MQNPLRHGFLIALAATAFAAPAAEAQLTTVSPVCTDFDGFQNQFGSVSYFQCGGAFEGNASNQDVVGWISTNWGFTTTFAGKTDAGAGDSGPFAAYDDEEPTGTLVFDSPMYGDFVLALKAGNSFSLYNFTGADGWESLTYSTAGAGVNKWGKAQGLSNVSIYSVPEPGSMMLLLVGAFGLFIVARRRKPLLD